MNGEFTICDILAPLLVSQTLHNQALKKKTKQTSKQKKLKGKMIKQIAKFSHKVEHLTWLKGGIQREKSLGLNPGSQSTSLPFLEHHLCYQ